MSNPGEWIDFAELCRRIPTKSARTLRRYVASGLISSRQLVRRGRIEFNWRTVERELKSLETVGVNAAAAAAPIPSPTVEAQLEELRGLLTAIARKVGVA